MIPHIMREPNSNQQLFYYLLEIFRTQMKRVLIFGKKTQAETVFCFLQKPHKLA